MPILRIINTTATQWAIRHEVPRLLHPAGAFSAPGQAPSVRIAGSHSAIRGESYPGASAGVRRPHSRETRLSADEVAHGLVCGVIGVPA